MLSPLLMLHISYQVLLFSLKFKKAKISSPLLNYLGHSHFERVQFLIAYYWDFFFFGLFLFFNLTHSLSLEGMHFSFREMQ